MARDLPTVRHQRCFERCQKEGVSCAAQCEGAVLMLRDHFTRHRWWQFWLKLPEPRLTAKEEERLQRLRDRAYHLQNKIDARPRAAWGHTRAELSAVCWAVEKIGGKPFHPAITQRGAKT